MGNGARFRAFKEMNYFEDDKILSEISILKIFHFSQSAKTTRVTPPFLTVIGLFLRIFLCWSREKGG